MNGQHLMFRLTTKAKITCEFRRLRGVQEQNVQFCLIYRDPHDRLIKVGTRERETYQPTSPTNQNRSIAPLISIHQRIGTEEMAAAFDDNKDNFLRRHREYSAQLAAGNLAQRNRMELLVPPPLPAEP